MNKSLQVNNLTLARGTKTLCRDLSLTISPGDFWAVLGPNGCGKTTLLHALAGHLAPRNGKILLNDARLTTLSTRHIAQEIGILFQELHHAFPQSVAEYCRAACFPHHSPFSSHHNAHADADLTANALQAMQLTTLAACNIQQLSGGEQRRAAIAALLVQSPVFFLLDEPANHLDLPHQIHAMNTLAALTHRHRAIFMSLHDINLAERYCNKILMLFSDGTALHGTRRAILTKENLSRLYQHPIDVILHGEQPYWLPRQHNKEESCQSAY